MVNFYIKVNEVQYPSQVPEGRNSDPFWDGRETKTFRLEMTYADAMRIFTDGIAWSIVTETIDDETGETFIDEFDNSDINVAGDVTDHRDGTVSITMGKMTDLEEAYELLYGGNEE